MSKAVYFFCADNAKDPVAGNVFRDLTGSIPTYETDVEIDGFNVLEYTDEKKNIYQFVRTDEVLSHDYNRYIPYLREYFSEFDFAGVVNWHAGANAPEKVLTVHSTGDVNSGIFGRADPALFKNLIVAINGSRIQSGLDDFIVSTEATHWSGIPYHGKAEWIKDYAVPVYDVEIGSCENSWKNETASKVLASALCGVFSNAFDGSPVYSLLCVGGVHFEESFASAILSEKHPLSIGHILPNQWLVSGGYDDGSGFDKLQCCIDSVMGGIHAIVFHDNLKSAYKQLCRELGAKYDLPVIKHKSLKNLDEITAACKKE